MDFAARQKKLRDHLSTTRFDAFLISHLPNIQYLCGFTGSAGLLLVEEAGSVFFTDVRYDTQAHEQVKAAKLVIARKALLPGLGEWLGGRRKRARGWTIAIEAEHFTIADKKRLTRVRPAGMTLKDAPVVERMRMIKDSEELSRIRAAVALGARLFDRALEVLRPGMKETEVAGEMELAPAGAVRRRCHFQRLLPREQGPHSHTGALRSSQFPQADSWSATSVLYSQVIVRTRPALSGWALWQMRPAGFTQPCTRHSRRRLTPSDRGLGSVKSTPQRVRYCVRPG